MIDTFYYIIRNKLIHLHHDCFEFVSKSNDTDDIIMIDNTNIKNKRKSCGTFQSGPLAISCFHERSIGSYLTFNSDNEDDNESKENVVIKTENINDDDIEILSEKKHKPKQSELDSKSGKMELDEDEDDDVNLSFAPIKIESISSLSTSRSMSKINTMNGANYGNYTVLNERYDKFEMFDQYGDYYQNLYEEYEPFGTIIDDYKTDNYLNKAIETSIKQNDNNPNYWNCYLDYDYNKINDNIDKKSANNENESENETDENIINRMKSMFKQWKDTNNEMYKLNGIMPGYIDEHGNIQTHTIDKKTNKIDYGTLDDFVRNLRDPHIYRLYTQEKQSQKKQIKQEKSNTNTNKTAVAALPKLTASISVPITNTNTNINTTKPKRIKLKINSPPPNEKKKK
eukprot:415699_1